MAPLKLNVIDDLIIIVIYSLHKNQVYDSVLQDIFLQKKKGFWVCCDYFTTLKHKITVTCGYLWKVNMKYNW